MCKSALYTIGCAQHAVSHGVLTATRLLRPPWQALRVARCHRCYSHAPRTGPPWLHMGHRSHQGLGVGVLRVVEQIGRCPSLHDLPLVQHHDLVAQVVHHGQIVADEQEAHAKFLLQVLQQVEHLGLHRHIQRAHGLIGHDEPGPGDQGAGNGNALALAA